MDIFGPLFFHEKEPASHIPTKKTARGVRWASDQVHEGAQPFSVSRASYFMNLVPRGRFSSCLGFISCLSVPFTSKSFKDSSLTHAFFFFFCNNCGFQLLNEIYMFPFLWASKLNFDRKCRAFLVTIPSVYLSFLPLRQFSDHFSLGTNCILKFPFRTGFLEIKSLRVYLLSKCFQFPFILESPCCWLTVLGWQVLVDIVWKPVGLGVCHELSAIILPFPFVDVAFLAGPSIFYLHLLCWGILMPCI